MADNSTNVLHGKTALPQILVSTDGGSVFSAVAELIDPSLPSISVDSGETTSTDIADGFKTFLAGWADGGDHSLVSNYREDTYVQLKALIGQDIDIKVTWTDPLHVTTDSAITYSAHLSALEQVNPMGEVHTLNWSLKVSGDVTFTVGTEV